MHQGLRDEFDPLVRYRELMLDQLLPRVHAYEQRDLPALYLQTHHCFPLVWKPLVMVRVLKLLVQVEAQPVQ
tara:strand:- start:254 stop:469 length:216 start_codon:yes stop_codon:yes gene_type:complete